MRGSIGCIMGASMWNFGARNKSALGTNEVGRNELPIAGCLPRSLGCGLRKAQTFARDDSVKKGKPKGHSQEWLCHKTGTQVLTLDRCGLGVPGDGGFAEVRFVGHVTR